MPAFLIGFVLLGWFLMYTDTPQVRKPPIIKKARIVTMTGHLQFDRCYVVTNDAEKNTYLHTILCSDTLEFKARNE